MRRFNQVFTSFLQSRFDADGGGGAMRVGEAEGSTPSVATHLRRARDVLAKPGVWSQNEYARDVTGRPVDSCWSGAEQFCCSGALYATEGPGDRTVLARALLAQVIRHDIEIWNDTVGRQRVEVLEAFDRAIAIATARSA